MRSLLCALSLCVGLLPAAEPEFPLAEAKECRPRTGLPNFLAKAQGVFGSGARPEIKVAYLGGSITAQPGWRVKSLAHFQQAYPGVKFSEINAAIGGTGSDLGVFRLQQDVLSKQPDLLFVEFAVNDGGAAPDQIIRCMEGIVRQTWRANPSCDICFVYTLVEGMAPTVAGGKFPRAASAMEQVAEHYGIPTIHFGLEVSRLSQEGKVLWKAPLPKTPEAKAALGDKVVFAPDGVHPHVETGHRMYLEAIARSLPAIGQASGKPLKHELPAPLAADNFEDARLVPIPSASLPAGVAPLDPQKDALAKSHAHRLPSVVRLTQPGQVIEFKFKGTHCAIYDVIGPAGGKMAVTLDGAAPKVVTRFDAYCTYARLSTFTVGTRLPDSVHTVRLELLPDAFDKAAILAQRKEKIDQPGRFADRHFLPGGLLLRGELVP
ncbi:MAG: GDSL-type esterase/lipase family protein [Opitutia bacterium]